MGIGPVCVSMDFFQNYIPSVNLSQINHPVTQIQ